MAEKQQQEKKQALLLGRYEMEKLLGQGANRTRNVKTDEDVAIKIIDKEKMLKDGLIGNIMREALNLRRVRHPDIVQLFEVMATKTKIYFVMEYVREERRKARENQLDTRHRFCPCSDSRNQNPKTEQFCDSVTEH